MDFRVIFARIFFLIISFVILLFLAKVINDLYCYHEGSTVEVKIKKITFEKTNNSIVYKYEFDNANFNSDKINCIYNNELYITSDSIIQLIKLKNGKINIKELFYKSIFRRITFFIFLFILFSSSTYMAFKYPERLRYR